jgi:hypothetical protein
MEELIVGMNARMTPNGLLYNPHRDVAHNFKEVAELVAGRLEDHSWHELSEVLIREGVSMDQLGEAMGCFCTYLASAADPDKSDWSMCKSIQESGFFDCDDAAQVAVMACFGQAFAGIQFAGIREVSLDGEGPMLQIKELGRFAEEFRQIAADRKKGLRGIYFSLLKLLRLKK